MHQKFQILYFFAHIFFLWGARADVSQPVILLLLLSSTYFYVFFFFFLFLAEYQVDIFVSWR